MNLAFLLVNHPANSWLLNRDRSQPIQGPVQRLPPPSCLYFQRTYPTLSSSSAQTEPQVCYIIYEDIPASLKTQRQPCCCGSRC